MDLLTESYTQGLSGHHFIVASIPDGNEPSISQCAIECGKAGLWSGREDRSAETSGLCPYPGISAEYFLWLAYILNFTFEVQTPKNGSYGKHLEDGTWDGVVGMLARGEADVSFHPIFMTIERAEVIHYGPVVYDRPLYGFLYKNPSGANGMFSAFYPLNWTIYTAVAVAFILAFLVTFSLALYKNYRKKAKFQTMVDVLWTMGEMDAARLKGRFTLTSGIVLFGWFLVAYTLASAYRSNLIVSAIGESDQLPLNNLNEAGRLLRADQLRLVSPKDNIGEFYNVLEALPSVSVVYETWAKLLSNYTPAVADDALEMAKYLSDTRYAFFGDVRSVTWMFVKNPPPSDVVNLDVTFARTAQGAATNSLGFRKDFPYKEQFHAAMMLMMTDTVMEQLVKKYFPDRYQSAGAAADFDEQDKMVVTRSYSRKIGALNFWQLLNLFSLWSIGCGSASIVFLIELFKVKLARAVADWKRSLRLEETVYQGRIH